MTMSPDYDMLCFWVYEARWDFNDPRWSKIKDARACLRAKWPPRSENAAPIAEATAFREALEAFRSVLAADNSYGPYILESLR